MSKEPKSLPPPVWTLRHINNGMKCSLLGNHSLKAALAFIDPKEKSQWWISRVGETKETLLQDFHWENEPSPQITDKSKSLPSIPKVPTQPGVKLSDEERRRFQRKSLQLRTLILSGNEVFRTYTDNISLSGIRLATSAPEHFLNSECKVILQSPDQSENIELSFSFVGRLDNKVLNRMHFGDNTEEFVKKLAQWLDIKESSQAA